MCLTRNSRKVKIGNRVIRVDRCLVGTIKWLNALSIETVACCCGHGKYFKTIICKDEDKFIEFYSQKVILRKAKFYRKDPGGFFFIPEALIKMVKS